MRRFLSVILICIGSLLLLVTTLKAQDDDDAEYVGARECSACHGEISQQHSNSRHTLALQNVERDADLILGDFEQGEEIRTVTFPDDDEPRAVETDDILYAIGSGRHVQRYLYEVDRDEYMVFPFEWNIAEARWQPFTLAENWPDPAYDWVKNCAGCHTTGLNAERGRWEDDGVLCEACHGPGSVHVEAAEDAGNNPNDREFGEIREAITRSVDAQVCGQCHSRGVEPDDELPYPVEYRPGGDLMEAFTLVDTDDPVHWWSTGHAAQPNMQFNEWMNSAHANSLVAVQNSDFKQDQCLTCHSADYRQNQTLLAAHEDETREGDPPESLTVETAQFGVTCATCHNPHADPSNDFFLEVEPYEQCITCHTASSEEHLHHPVKEMFEGATIVENVSGIPSGHFSAENGPDCLTCHMGKVPVYEGQEIRSSHTLKPILPGEVIDLEMLQDSCTACHQDQVNAVMLQTLIDDTQTSTQARIASAQQALQGDEPAWVQVALDFVVGDNSLGIHNYAYTDALLDAVEGVLQPVAEETLSPPTDTTVITTPQIDEEEEDALTPIALGIMVVSVVILLGAAWVFFIKQEDSHE